MGVATDSLVRGDQGELRDVYGGPARRVLSGPRTERTSAAVTRFPSEGKGPSPAS